MNDKDSLHIGVHPPLVSCGFDCPACGEAELQTLLENMLSCPACRKTYTREELDKVLDEPPAHRKREVYGVLVDSEIADALAEDRHRGSPGGSSNGRSRKKPAKNLPSEVAQWEMATLDNQVLRQKACERISVRLNDDTQEQIEDLCERAGIPVPHFIEMAIRASLIEAVDPE